MNNQLKIMDKKLQTIEKKIGDNIKAAWYQNGLLLSQIRDEKLYKNDYETFEDYIKQRWELSERHAYRLLDSASLVKKIEQISKKVDLKGQLLPSSETHIRPLIESLKSDSERVKVWSDIAHASKSEGKKITQSFVQAKVDAFIQSGESVEEIDFTPPPPAQPTPPKPKTPPAPPVVIQKNNEPAPIPAGKKLVDIEEYDLILEEAESTNSELATIQKILDADDQLAEAIKEIKSLKAQAVIDNSRIDSLIIGKNEAERSARAWKKKYEECDRKLTDLLIKEVGV